MRLLSLFIPNFFFSPVLCFGAQEKMLSAALCSDILAIVCINEHVCIGVGNFLNVYEIKSRELVAKLDVLRHDNIHGIVRGPDTRLFVYGGKNFSICELEIIGDTVKLNLSSVGRFNSWIIAVGWADDEQHLSILFAHNNLGFYSTKNEKIQTVQCQEKCILYGGSVLAKNDRKTVVFSGTVFQEILIWQAVNCESANDIPVLQRLRGHKGVIFSVVYDPILKIISSTSDDRTIRVWKVTNKRNSESNEIGWEDCEIRLTRTMYGHTARVWRSIVRSNKIISIGEDSLMCVWSIDGKLLNKAEAHRGAEIWSIDVTDDNKMIFTGGADGAVNVWPFEFTDDPEGSPIFASDEEKVPKFVFYTNHGNIFIFMDGGHLITYDQRFERINASLNLPRYLSYCVVEISPDRRKIVLGSKDGYVDVYEDIHDEEGSKLRHIGELKIMESKIFSIHWLSNETILVGGDAGLLKLIDKITKIMSVRSSFVLPTSRERWTTAAILHKNLLICGDRAGSVYVFNLNHDDNDSAPTQVFPKIHGRLGVQSFSISINKILSTGRDGTLRFYELNDESGKIRALHLNKMPMDWVCRIQRTKNDLYVLGFKEIELMIYSMNLKRIVRRFLCGGGHRSWDCTIDNGKMNFAYIRNKRVYELECSLGNIDLPIINGYHTKEIYCVQPLVTSSHHNILVSAGEDCTLRVACIVFEKSQIQEYRIDTLDTYDGHISNVKSLAILNLQCNDKFTKNLVISGGGRAQLKVWEIIVKFDGKTLTNEDVTCTELSSYMLRGTDKERKKNWQMPAFLVDPETRFMDINAQIYQQDSNLVVIFIACSDGYVRTLLYDVRRNLLHLSNIVYYCDRCTLRINIVECKNETILMTMTTDGIMSFWQTRKSIENLVTRFSEIIEKETVNKPFSRMRIHQSGINSFDFRKIDDSRWLLLTGGDDNLLSLIVIEITSTINVFSANTLTSWNSSSIHAAQITGAKFVDDNRIISTGIDQRVVVHSYAYIDGVLSVSLIEDTMTLVPDVQGLALLRTIVGNDETLVCVYGKGLEVIVLKPDSRCTA